MQQSFRVKLLIVIEPNFNDFLYLVSIHQSKLYMIYDFQSSILPQTIRISRIWLYCTLNLTNLQL